MSNTTIKTLKTAKVGDKVSMLGFTGMNLGQFEISKAGKTKLAITKKNGDVVEFSRETGIQTNANNPKYANKIVDPIPEVEKKAPAKKEEKPAKPAKKAAKKEEAEVTAEVETAVEEKPAKKATKPAAKKAPAKKVEKVEIPEDAEDFEDEDMDDDFEEFEDEE